MICSVSYGAKKLAEARLAQQAGNLAALAAAAHPLKSSAGNVGATACRNWPRRSNYPQRRQKAELAGAQLGELERAFAEAEKFLEAERARLAEPPA